MLDGFRFYMADKTVFERKVTDDRIFHLDGRYSIYTGEAYDYPKSGRWQGLDMQISKEHGFLKGSLHKFFNNVYYNQDQNYDDYSLSKIRETIDLMSFRFGKELIEKSSVNTLEMGFNIIMPESPKSIIEHKVLMYNFKAPNIINEFNGDGFEKEFWKGDYRWKIYDKGLQYKIQDRKILRVELKIVAPRVLQRYGIYNPSDLLLEENLKKIFEFFLKEFENLMIIDNLGTNLNIVDRQTLLKITNPTHWLEFQKFGISRKITDNRKSKAKEIIQNNMLNLTHIYLREEMQKKFTSLLKA